MEVVAVLGASNDPSRYSYKAVNMLREYGHTPIPINPREDVIQDLPALKSLGDLAAQGKKIDTVTVYVNPALSSKYEKEFILAAPKRVIFNPGAENPDLEKSLKAHGIEVENACTLVLLRTDQY